MAAKHKRPLNQTTGRGGNIHNIVGPPPAYRFSISSADPLLSVEGWLTGKPVTSHPKPKYTVHDRPGDFGLQQYIGHDPFEMTLPIKFEARDSSVEGKVSDLERFLRRTASNGETPIVKVAGNGVSHSEYNWRLTGIEENVDRRIHLHNGDRRVYVAIVSLTQQVTERVLAESLKAFNRKDRGAGISNRKWTVRQGERNLYDVARDAFHDPSAAMQIAVANGMAINSHIKPGDRLRLP